VGLQGARGGGGNNWHGVAAGIKAGRRNAAAKSKYNKVGTIGNVVTGKPRYVAVIRVCNREYVALPAEGVSGGVIRRGQVVRSPQYR